MRAHKIRSACRAVAWMILLAAAAACGMEPQVILHQVRINAAPPAAQVTAGYLMLENSSPAAVTLVRVSSPDYSRIELHRSVLIDGIARMEPLQSVTVAPGGHLEFRPGDYHLMLYREPGPLPEGGTALLIFYFDDGTEIETTARVTAITGGHHH